MYACVTPVKFLLLGRGSVSPDEAVDHAVRPPVEARPQSKLSFLNATNHRLVIPPGPAQRETVDLPENRRVQHSKRTSPTWKGCLRRGRCDRQRGPYSVSRALPGRLTRNPVWTLASADYGPMLRPRATNRSAVSAADVDASARCADIHSGSGTTFPGGGQTGESAP